MDGVYYSFYSKNGARAVMQSKTTPRNTANNTIKFMRVRKYLIRKPDLERGDDNFGFLLLHPAILCLLAPVTKEGKNPRVN